MSSPPLARRVRRRLAIPLVSLIVLAIAACADTQDPHGTGADSGVALPSTDAGTDVALDVAAETGARPCGIGQLCTVPTPLAYGSITAIVGRSHEDVWASGSGGLLSHWDGRAWAPFGVERSDTLSALFSTADETWGTAGDLVVRAKREPKSVRTTRLEGGGTIRSLSVAPSGKVYVSLGAGSWSNTNAVARLDFETSSLTYLADPVLPWTDGAQALSVRAGFLVAGEALWVVGDQGLVARYPAALLDHDGDTEDAGDTQASAVILPTTSRASLLAAWGHGRQLWAAGSGGTLLHFDGAEWHRAVTGTTATLHAIFGLSPTDIWAAGDDGVVLHSDGQSWAVVDASPYRGSLRAIWAAAPDDVWIGGEAAMLHWGALP